MNNIRLKKSCSRYDSKNFGRRGVAPIIATLLLVVIAVVGGSLIFSFSQGFFATAQISDSPQIEHINILGYDATDGDTLQFHDGFVSTGMDLYGNGTSNGLNESEYVAVYLKNESVNKITISEIRIVGDIYTYEDFGGATLPTFTNDCSATTIGNLDCGEYTLVTKGDGPSFEGVTVNSSSPSLEPGQTATLIFALEKDVKTGRDMQFKLSTAGGAVFVGTLQSGQLSG